MVTPRPRSHAGRWNCPFRPLRRSARTAYGRRGNGLAAGKRWRDHGLVFASQAGTLLDAAHVRRAFKAITEKAGLGANWTPRELRHSAVEPFKLPYRSPVAWPGASSPKRCGREQQKERGVTEPSQEPPPSMMHSIRPGVSPPDTVLVAVMTDGSYLLMAYPQREPAAFVARDMPTYSGTHSIGHSDTPRLRAWAKTPPVKPLIYGFIQATGELDDKAMQQSVMDRELWIHAARL
jgi:hypothetical protein